MVEDPEEEKIRLLTERTLDMAVESGVLMQIAMSQDAQEDVNNVAGQTVDRVKEEIQTRRNDTTPVSAATQAREMEARSGTPGSQSIPRAVAEAGMAQANPSQTGLPGR